MIAYVKSLTEKYNFVFIEDMLDENDWDGYEKAHREITRTLIIADDFTVSNKERIVRAFKSNSIDGFILKPNQVGTISEALDAHYFAQENNLFSITSGRSGGVIGDVVMDLAVGLQIPFIKNGCPRSGERIEKLNFLMRVKDDYSGCHMASIDKYVKF
ncbi:Enolase [bioreactor metagenome]|uniref:phosphopyruvate hydratase n=1 Tax=bioreactor metagenome TaxID=1076179 RepID=A0A645ITF6_9ZZZZ